MPYGRTVRSTLVALLVGTIASSRPVHAQQAAAPDSACAYERCALRVEGRRLVRGARGETVASPGFFTPRPLLRFVAGDSARHYAAQYERAARRASVLSSVGAVALSGVLLAAQVGGDGCDAPPFECVRGAWNVTVGAAALGGAVALLASLPFSSRAERAQARALWWHNARFAR